MPLSEHEQRMLAEIESALYAEDPAFASTVRRTSSAQRRLAPGVIALAVVGVALLIGGLFIPWRPFNFPIVSLFGFLMVFAAGVLALRQSSSTPSARAGGSAGPRRAGNARKGSGTSGAGRRVINKQSGETGSYTARMEDRFKRRFEG